MIHQFHDKASNQLMETTEIIHKAQFTPENPCRVCYWPDGYWIQDEATAKLLDQVNAFVGKHKVVQVPDGVDINAEVKHLLKQSA